MTPGLRNEDYVAFLDESGDDDLQVVSGVLIPARWLRSAERRWQDFIRDHIGSRSGKVEIKSRDLIKGKGVSLHAQRALLAKGQALSAFGAGRQFYRDALEHIASIAEVRLLTVGLETKRPTDAYRLWFWLAYASLVCKPKPPRPRLPITVIDGEDASFRHAHDLIAHRFYRSFPKVQPYVTGGNRWFIGGSLHHASEWLPFVQMADLVAGAGRLAITKRKPFTGWYETHLRDFARQRKRDIDISQHALAELRRLAPKDKCQSGWSAAILVP